MIFVGLVSIFRGPLFTGVWWILIGFFLHNASRLSYQRLQISRAFAGEKVSRFMREDIIAVSPALTLTELVERYIYTHHYKMFPVVQNDALVGIIALKDLLAFFSLKMELESDTLK